MSFDEVNFPLAVSYGSMTGPSFSTEVVTLASGVEVRNQNWSQARRYYDAASGIRSAADAALLTAFFCARRGRARGFRLKDWLDFSSAPDGLLAPSVTDQVIGTGDGQTLLFQLTKTYGSGAAAYVRTIKKPVEGSVVIAVGGVVLQSGWSVDTTTGLIAFADAPLADATITAGFLFDVPVRFDTDKLELVAYDRGSAKLSVPLVEVKI